MLAHSTALAANWFQFDSCGTAVANLVVFTAAAFSCFAAPHAGPDGNAVFQQQLAAATQASVQAASAAAPAAAADSAPSQQQTAVMVTGVAGFPGCYQVAMHLVLPEGAAVGSQLQHLQQQMQEAAQGVVDAYAADCSLMSAQLQPVTTEVIRQVQLQRQQAMRMKLLLLLWCRRLGLEQLAFTCSQWLWLCQTEATAAVPVHWQQLLQRRQLLSTCALRSTVFHSCCSLVSTLCVWW
jgi:hypothetical protein